MPSISGETCGTCLKRPPHFDATFSALRYAFPADRLVLALKFGARLPVAALLAELMLERLQPEPLVNGRTSIHSTENSRRISPARSAVRAGGALVASSSHVDMACNTAPLPDLLIPMPLHRTRLAARGFNQSVEISRRLARQLQRPALTRGVGRLRDTPPQRELPVRRRRANVLGAFECSADLTGRSVAIVDDVMTTGATLDELARVLKRAGAIHVENWVAARTWPERNAAWGADRV